MAITGVLEQIAAYMNTEPNLRFCLAVHRYRSLKRGDLMDGKK